MENVCQDCFEDESLKTRIIAVAEPGTPCSFHPSNDGVPLSEVAKLFDEVIRTFYHLGAEDHDGDQRGDDLTTIVDALSGATQWEIAEAVARQLVEDDYAFDELDAFFDEHFGYEETNGRNDDLTPRWDRFRESILHGQRFFNQQAVEQLTDIFSGVEYQLDEESKSPVYFLGNEQPQTLFRGRVANDREHASQMAAAPHKELAAPPAPLRRSGRMNASGILAFYGAFDDETCLAELAPPVGGIVVVGQFRVVRPILVLDITRFDKPRRDAGIFSQDYLRKSSQWGFLRRFQAEISRPILDSESHLHYVPTQVAAEFLTSVLVVHVDGRDRHIDGIVYGSSQRPGGKNLVILSRRADAISETDPQPGDEQSTTASGTTFAWLEMNRTKDAGLLVRKSDITTHFVTGSAYRTSTTPPIADPPETVDDWDDQYRDEDGDHP